MTKIYLDYDQQALDDQYTQSVWVPDPSPHFAENARHCEIARTTIPMTADIAYGDHLDERLDIFRPEGAAAGDNRPVRVFFHGGAWLRNTKENAAYPAKLHTDAGALLVAVNFTKADKASLADMIGQCRRATAWVHENIANHGGDPGKIYVGGHSSGGHLGANVLVTDWPRHGLPEDVVKGAVLLSGIYDLEPVRLSVRNDYVHLDGAKARAGSPIHHLPDRSVPVVVGWSEKDADEFRRQGRAFADAWIAAGHPCQVIEQPGLNHFSGALTWTDPDSPLGRAALAQMGLV